MLDPRQDIYITHFKAQRASWEKGRKKCKGVRMGKDVQT